MAKIQIFTVVGKNGVAFAAPLYKNMNLLASKKNTLEFNCFMSSRDNPPKGWTHLENILKQKHTSLNHTTGLNRIIDYINGDYIIATDSDVAMLCPNWDQMLIDELETRKLHILGIDNVSEYCYRKFPIVTFFIAKSAEYAKINPDLRPDLVPYPNRRGLGARVITIATEEDASTYGVPINCQILADSGWRLPKLYKEAGLKGDILERIPPYVIPEVPQIWRLGQHMIVCHKGKGTKRRKSKITKFHHSISNYIKKQYKLS